MEIIRDNEMNGIMMIPLFQQWSLHKCNVKDCKDKQTTVIIDALPHPFALCEEHYKECVKLGKIDYTIEM